ncbi:MAG: methylmalonyl-CoA mutase [Acidobacteria bacterium]|nr:methylmalonyl-CoA mutase [Acidobacteriota bacterium]
MYRGRPWTLRQYAGFATAAESNRRFRYLLAHGVSGLSVAFDLPTQIGYDSDHPLAAGEVGRVGVAIDSIEDMAVLFDGIPLDRVSTSMTINATAIILLALYAAVARRQGAALQSLSGTLQNDILKEYVARGTYIYPPRPSLRIVTDVMGFCAREMPQWNPISISGYHIREAGATVSQEVAFTLAHAGVYVQAAIDFPRRDRQVPRGATDVGANHARPLRRDPPAGAAAPVPRADSGQYADGPAAGQQHRACRTAGARGRAWRRAVAAL